MTPLLRHIQSIQQRAPRRSQFVSKAAFKAAIAGLVFSLSLFGNTKPSAAATTTLSFANTPTLVSGTARTQGAVYRFANVAPGVDAMVQVATIQNAQLKVVDDNSTFPGRFQPTIAPSSASLTNATSYVRFDFKLTPSSTPSGTLFTAAPAVTATNVYFSAQDIDGNSGTNTIREFVETINATTSYIANPTLLQRMATPPVAGGVGYEQINSQNVQAGIGTDDRYELYSFLGTSVSTFSVVGGNITGSAGCPLNDAGCDRQNSYTFDVADVQKLDFGDAPVVYGDAYHPVPPSPAIFLGASIDGDDGPNYTASANGDDITGIDDEDGVASFPPLLTNSTSYSLNLTCAGTNTPVAGWIDFNKNGTFENTTEKASGTCNGSTVTLNWTGLSGLNAGNTYARFRTSSIAAEIINSTGQASNGEVEDYQMAIISPPVTVSGTVFSDADADVTINGSDSGTNAGSPNLTVYAVDGTGKAVAKATVAANGAYSLTNVPANASVTLRLSNVSTVAVGATAPTAASIPNSWYFTGQNKNGTVDGTIATLGNISLTTATTNITNQNFGIRQAYTIAADVAPATCNPDYRTEFNTGISRTGQQLAVGANDLNWTSEWIAGPASGTGTPYATPRPLGSMPALVVGNLAPGAWVNEQPNARWISYPFRLSNNSNGNHQDADLDGTTGENNPTVGPTSDAVRLKFTASLSLPSNANTIAVSVPIGVSMDNQFISIKVNGVENLVPTPTPNPQTEDYRSLRNVNVNSGWQAGVNTIEIVMDSGPPLAGFFLGIQANTTQVCSDANVLLVKRITAINGQTTNPNDGTSLTATVNDGVAGSSDDASNWPTNYLRGEINAGAVKPGDDIEYTIYFLNSGGVNASAVRICDRLFPHQSLLAAAYGAGRDAELQLGTGSVIGLTAVSDTSDRAEFVALGGTVAATCNLNDVNSDGTLVIDVTGPNGTGNPALTALPGSTGSGSPNDSYGLMRFKTRITP